MHEAPTMRSSKTNNVGIITFDAFSIPLRTPFSIIRCAISRMTTVQNTGFTGSDDISIKYVLKYSGSPCR